MHFTAFDDRVNFSSCRGNVIVSVGATQKWDSTESSELLKWVHKGGGLLLGLDHKGMQEAYTSITKALGIRPHRGTVASRQDGCWSIRDCCHFGSGKHSDGAIHPHEITSPGLRRQVVTFSGCAFPPFRNATPLLTLNGEAISVRKMPWIAHEYTEEDAVDVSGWWSAAAVDFGSGRIVVICETSWAADNSFLRPESGLFHKDNAWFAQKILHWIAQRD